MAGEYEDAVNQIGAVDLPYGKSLRLEEVVYEGGMKLLRLRIREGSRFTVVELDAASAAEWAGLMADWSTSGSE